MAAVTGALLFVALPAAAPAVCWISSIGDLLSAFFAVCAALLYVKTDRTRVRTLLMGGLFALALFSKEMSVTLPFLLAIEWQHAGTFQKNLLTKIASIPGDTLQFGNFPRMSYSSTLLANHAQLRAGLAYLYGIDDRTIYIYAPRWYEHLAPDAMLRLETAAHFTLTITPGRADFFAPYLVNESDSSGVEVRFSDYTSFSGRPRAVSIDFPYPVKLIQVEPVVNCGN